MRIAKLLVFVFLALELTFCGQPLPTLEGIDLEQWKNDPNGCAGIRTEMRDAIDREKEKLLRLDELQVAKLLGKPDEHELYTRNQKFYHYYLSSGPACKNSENKSERLTIRFNAMGLAKEVALE